MKNKAYRAFPLGQQAGAYLRQNRGRLLPNTYKTYESCLDKLARYFADLELSDFDRLSARNGSRSSWTSSGAIAPRAHARRTSAS